MSTCFSYEAASMRIIKAQEAWLHDRNFVVRSTFIDVKEEDEEQVNESGRSRARSLPAGLGRFSARKTQASVVSSPGNAGEQALPMRSASGLKISLFDSMSLNDTDAATTSGGSSSPRTESVSTACSECCAHDLLAERVRELQVLVSDECSFMRVEGSRFIIDEEDPELGVGRKANRNTSAMLCIFVRGLPWVKRAKWRHPLLRSAATALQRVGVDAAVVGGNLFVNYPGAGRVLVDFAAAR